MLNNKIIHFLNKSFFTVSLFRLVLASWIATDTRNAYAPTNPAFQLRSNHYLYKIPVARPGLAATTKTPEVSDIASKPPVDESKNISLNLLEAEVEKIVEQLNEKDSALSVLAGNIALCLHKSDLKRDDGFDGASTGWTSWVDGEAAMRLQNCMDALELPSFIRNPQHSQTLNLTSEMDVEKRDEVIRWIRWIKTCPSPLIMELSPELRRAVNATIPNEKFLDEVDSDHNEFLQRIGCRLIVLPSGASLSQPLRAPPGAMIYGKLLLGGVTRFRMIGSSQSTQPRRKAGARTLITSSQEARTTAWLQYGGPERSYEAVDAGPCAFMEVLILPKGMVLPLVVPIDDLGSANTSSTHAAGALELVADTTIGLTKWNLDNMLTLVSREEAEEHQRTQQRMEQSASESQEHQKGMSSEGNDFVGYLESSFTSSVGGLQPQIESIVRRVLDGRALASASEYTTMSENSTKLSEADLLRRKEMEALMDLGLQPVRGLLLHGPPGTGKTLVAREIANVLKARKPKIVSAPELLDRWVGGSERLVRELFQDAEDELRSCNGDATKSALHVVVIDEIDAVFRKRSSSADDGSGEVTRASAVNQILAKLDGVKELGNILLIGMTNRKELLDEALLRPGRLEVQIEIPLPDKEGRREIMKIHFEALRRRGLLSQTLCNAIDGKSLSERSDSHKRISRLSFWRKNSKGTHSSPLWHRKIRDLAADRWTKGFSGADIAGLVRAAGSLALARARKQDGGGLDNLLVTLEDVAQALQEVKQ